MTGEEQAWLLRQQNLTCPGCLRRGSETVGPDGAPWQVDHDHEVALRHPHEPQTGCRYCVRAILCSGCNRALGFVRDEAATLRRLADYVEAATALRARK